MSVVAPDGQATANMKQVFARNYGEILALTTAATESGVDDLPEYRETMQWLRVKTLAEVFRRRLQKESNIVTDAELDAYYSEQLSRFEEVKLSRVLLPRSDFAVTDQQAFDLNAQRIAVEVRERAAKGEDLDTLQKEAYQALGFDAHPPVTSVGNRRRANLSSAAADEVFSLQPGEVSQVLKETYSYVIYKVEAKWTLPEKQVREEIRRDISKQKFEQALRTITDNIRTEFNPTYFGTASAQ